MKINIIFEFDNEFVNELIDEVYNLHNLKLSKKQAIKLIKENLFLYGNEFFNDKCVNQMQKEWIVEVISC